MRTHYLPKKYLSRFSVDPSSDIVWQYDRKERTFKDLTVSAVGVIQNWFTPETEKQLSSIEGDVIKAMNKLADSHEQLGEDEENAVCVYIATMMQRGLSSRTSAVASATEEYRRLRRDPEFQVRLVQAGWDPEEVFELFDQDGTRERLIADTSKLVFKLPKVQDVFLRMRWTVFWADGDRHFITSDAPVFYDKAAGLIKLPSDLTFPISSKAVLYLRWENLRDSAQAIDFKQVDDRIQDQLNRRAVYYSTRFTFSSRNDPWVEKLSDNKRQIPVMRLARLWSDPRLS